MDAAAGSLSIHGLSKTYRLEGRPLPVLERIDLETPPGSFTSIVGASGCGKSTLLRLIVGLDNEYDGAIMVGGRRIDGPGLDRGIVFQEHRLFPWLTVQKNVALGLEGTSIDAAERRATVAEHIRLVGLEGFERAYPRELSGGMAQRTALASRALVNRPEILLLDEPFGALDALTRIQMQNELLRLWKAERITMILVTHDIEEAVFLGQEVVVMDSRPGRIRRRLRVEREYPRDRADAELSRVRRELLAEFEMGSASPPKAHV